MTIAVTTDVGVSEDRIGGKARGLIQLQAAGFLVPPFVVSPEDVGEAVRQLGVPLAVRSSASMEDGHSTSFAGQFRSFLNLQSVEQVESAIRACHGSLHSPSVREYCRHSQKPLRELRMNVIVQRMIQPQLAGVAFSVNPATGAEEVVIEACEGLADDLLSGRQTPLPDDHPLLQMYGAEIRRTVLAIQRHFGSPQDVEFAVQGGKVYVLQSRPITRIEFRGQPGEWTNADFRDGGVSSRVCTPLMWSLYESAWERALKRTLRELHLFEGEFQSARMFFGRPYWNVGEVKRCVARLPGFKEREFDRDLSIRGVYDGDGLCTPLTLAGVLRSIPTVLATGRFLRRQEATARRLLTAATNQTLDQFVVTQASCDQLFSSLVARDYLPLETEYFRTIYAVSLAKMDLLSSFPEAEDRSLVAGLPPLRHMAPLDDVRRLRSRTTERLRKIVLAYRHHSRLGLDVCLPRWDEDESFVIEMLRDLPVPSGRDPRACYQQAYARIRRQLSGWRRPAFERKLHRLRRLVWLREEMRDLSNQMYYRLRRTVLAIARRRGLHDDIFMMTHAQITADDRGDVEHQRHLYQSYRNFRPPNEIGDRYRQPTARAAGALQGVGASSGVVRGRVFVATDVRQVSQMPAGHVLVCPFTDPGWTPVLDRAVAVVTETGGLLSHAAVICREYGIPAVLGVENATQRLCTGQEVVVRGDVGLVEVKPKPIAEED